MSAEVMNAEEYGAFSPKWMIMKAARHVPRENLEAVFDYLVEYVHNIGMENPVADPSDMLDLVGQGLLTGRYVRTAFPEEKHYEIRMSLADEDDEPSAGDQWLAEHAITEDEIEAFAAEMEDWPETKEPDRD